ncbi:MAG: hypothetical protein M1831_006517 [Alyxoria varia]|nr:MAG: hypothetical protein M1831_006517 [Alyxoria varia]
MASIKCANSLKDTPFYDNKSQCDNEGTKVCKGCVLVAYCSKQCQEQHWPAHRGDCKKSVLAKDSWRPRWALEGRKPGFVTRSGVSHVPFGALPMRNLWGNTPAIDVLQLEQNEGESYAKDLSVCFAASGNIRNVLQTVVSVPESYKGTLKVVMNDIDMDVVALNFCIIALLARGPLEKEDCLDTVIHLWYSARLKPSHVDAVKAHVRPIVADVVDKIQNQGASQMLSKKMKLTGGNTLRVILKRDQWMQLLSKLDSEPPAAVAKQSRDTMLSARIDHHDRALFEIRRNLHQRCSRNKFRHDGVLVPFGACADECTIPNPFLHTSTGQWTQKDAADPLHGWHEPSIAATNATHPTLAILTSDLYGRLYHHVHTHLSTFQSALRTRPLHFTLTSALFQSPDFPVLASGGEKQHTHDRLDVSNLSDTEYIGMRTILPIARPLLDPENPHATLLCLFLNTIPIQEDMRLLREPRVWASAFLEASRFLAAASSGGRVAVPIDPVFLRVSHAKSMFLPFGRFFR